ncbi:ParA family protein [Sphingobacterium bovistauri]|uniref:ParA family protein n=1 Tax=Sphingobacterium bovistauri TaxID=2781959 RepID=A0ABS7Z1J7_9SPHI|nr:ParA family protein [Sphingobacterium bovistauri]MCA5004050.1 ParA family protein [Sphingobacterium bovistauri]
MIIVIANFKGGVGRSTLTLALANYLSQEHRKFVTVLDLDFKQSLVNMQKNTLILQTPSLYTVYSLEQATSANLVAQIEDKPHQILLVDTPSNIQDSHLSEYYSLADLIICPFSYDQFTTHATILFSLVISKINPRAPICYMPNRIKSTANIESKRDIEKVLSNFGTISSIIYDKIDFQNLTNIHTPVRLLTMLLPAFDNLYHQYIYK